MAEEMLIFPEDPREVQEPQFLHQEAQVQNIGNAGQPVANLDPILANIILGNITGDVIISQAAGRKKTHLTFETNLDQSVFDNSQLYLLVDDKTVYTTTIKASDIERSGTSLVCTFLSPAKAAVNKTLTAAQRGNVMLTAQLHPRVYYAECNWWKVVVQTPPVPFKTEKSLKRDNSVLDDAEHRDAHACKKSKRDSANVIVEEVPPYDFRVTVVSKTSTQVYSFCNHTTSPISLGRFNLAFKKLWVEVVPVVDEVLPVKLEKQTVCLLRGAVHGLYLKNIAVENRNNALFATIQGTEYQCHDNRLQLARNSPQLKDVFDNEERVRISNDPTHFEATTNGLLIISTGKQALKVTTSAAHPISFTVSDMDRFSANVFECEGFTVTIQRQNTDE